MTEQAEELKKLYRYQEVTYAGPLDEFDEPTGLGRTEVILHEYPVFKTTKKGAWIYLYNHSDEYKRFVNLAARKQFACKTKELAKASFIHRKQAHLSILLAQANRIKSVLSMVGVQAKVTESFRGPQI